ncbi:MAG: DUF6029 family protein [Deltaproteobacteria bacterium]|nr:DUF6029 family protein [Deltaproteobacteria bacterium]
MLGNGLLLSVVKRDEFGEDHTVRGGLWQWQDPEGYVQLTALGGLFNEGDNLSFKPDRASEDEPRPEDQDNVMGGQISLGVPGWGFVDGRALTGTLRFEETTGLAGLERDDRYTLAGVGGRWLNLGGFGSVEGEYAWYDLDDRKRVIDDREAEGRAAYGRLNLAFGDFSFIAEGQDYYRFTFPFAEAPILEFEKQTFGHLPDREDILGGRAYGEYSIPGIDVSVFVNYYHARKHEVVPDDLARHYEGKDLDEWVEHTYGGAEKIWGNGAYVIGSGGYREEPEGRWVHGEFDAGVPVFERQEIALETRAKDFDGWRVFDGTDYGSYSIAPTWTYAGVASLTGRYEHSDEPLAAGTGQAFAQTGDDPDFWSAEARFQAKPTLDLRLFYGRIKGGLVCSGGVCRNVPPFDGFQTDVTLYF